MTTKRLTFKTVNKALVTKYGIADLELTQGNAYLYFRGGECHKWPESSIFTPRLNYLTLEEIFAEYDRLKANHEIYRLPDNGKETFKIVLKG